MEDLAEAGHTARWTETHYVVFGPSGIEIGTIERMENAWKWVEFTTEYDREVDVAPGSFASPADALHAMLEFGGRLV